MIALSHGMKGFGVAINPIVKSLIESIGVGSQGKGESEIFQTCFCTDLYRRTFNYRQPYFTPGIFQTNKEECLPAELPAQHRRKVLRSFCFL